MDITLNLNGQSQSVSAAPGESLMSALRRSGCWSVKHGCETGECGACAVLIDGALTPTCITLAGQAEGRRIVTVEDLAHGQNVHPLQQAFIDTGAIQCGFCTPAMLLAATALLEQTPSPTEAQVRDALSGVLCRCTGYKKPVEAVLRGAAMLRGEPVPSVEGPGIPFEAVFGHGRGASDDDGDYAAPGGSRGYGGTLTQPVVAFPVTLTSPAAADRRGGPP